MYILALENLKTSGSMVTGSQWIQYIMNLYKFVTGRPVWTPCWIPQLAPCMPVYAASFTYYRL